MPTENSLPSGQATSFLALSVYPRVGISLSASETDDRFHLSLPNISTSRNKEHAWWADDRNDVILTSMT